MIRPPYVYDDEGIVAFHVESYAPAGNTEIFRVSKQKAPDALDEFEEYQVGGWDGEDAQPITPMTLNWARRFHEFLGTVQPRMPEPNISPGPDGTIGFEWRSRASGFRKLFVEIRPDGTVRAYAIRSTDEYVRQRPVRLPLGMYLMNGMLSEFASETV